jgi:hypothetical protein
LAKAPADIKQQMIFDWEEIDRANVKQPGKRDPPLSEVRYSLSTNPFSEDRGMFRMRLAGQAVGR